MALLYSLVARDGVVLGEYTDEVGNFQTITRILLSRIPTTQSRVSYLYDEYIFHHYFRDNLCFLVMCPRTVNLRIPYLFLEDIANLVQSLFVPSQLRNALALSLNHQLAPALQERMAHWNRILESGGVTPEFAKIKSQIADIHDVMVDNIDKLLARSEKIGLLVDRSEQLQHDAVQFRRQAARYKRHVWWKTRRCMVILASVVAVSLEFLYSVYMKQ